MSISYQTGRRALWLFGAIGIVATLALLMGLAHPVAASGGRWGIRLVSSNLEVAHGSSDLTRGLNCWTMSVPGSFGGINLDSASRWWPNHQNGIMSIGAGPGATILTLDSYFVPLAPIATGSLLIAMVFKWRFPKRTQPGLCKICGYDLSGLRAGAPCPECGR
jgi:hypothetical protein